MIKFGKLPNVKPNDLRTEWLVAPVVVEHDSGILTKTNWRTQLAYLSHATHLVVRFGTDEQWFDVTIVPPEFESLIEHLIERLKDRDCLNEEMYETLRDEAIQNLWDAMPIPERIKCCKGHLSIFAARRGEVPIEIYQRLDYRVKD